MLTVIIYIRVSTDDQANKGYSIPSQLKSCRTKAKELGADKIIELVDDGYSGAFLDRPGMNELRDIIRQKKDSLQQKRENVIVLCYDPDRFARNLTHQLIVTEEIENSGASLEFINFEWQNTPEGRLFYSIRGAVSAFEREKIRERMVRGKRAKAEAGKVPNNNKPYGYIYDEELRNYVINDEEAEMIRQIFKWYTEEGLGMLKIAERLIAYGYPTRSGKGWSTTSIRNILNNEIYTGTVWAFKIYRHKTGQKTYESGIRPKEEWVPIPVPAIIDHATFAAAQKQAQRNFKLASRNTHHQYLLRNLMVCPMCGKRMKIYSSHGIKYYTCGTGKVANVKSLEPLPPKCNVRALPAEQIETLVWQDLINIANNPSMLKDIINRSQDKVSPNIDIRQKIEILRGKELKLSHSKEKILKLLRQDLINDEDAEKELKDIRKQTHTLSVERKRLELAQSNDKDIDKAKKTLLDKMKVLKGNMENADFETKRAIVLNIVDKIIGKRIDNGQSKHKKPVFEYEIKLKI